MVTSPLTWDSLYTFLIKGSPLSQLNQDLVENQSFFINRLGWTEHAIFYVSFRLHVMEAHPIKTERSNPWNRTKHSKLYLNQCEN